MSELSHKKIYLKSLLSEPDKVPGEQLELFALLNLGILESLSSGVQLPDLFEVLPREKAQHEFQRELTKIHSLCLSLLERNLVAV